jgi:hypothetical protein
MEESVRCFDQAYYIDVKEVRQWMVKGLSLFRNGQSDEGLRCFSEVLGILMR